MSKWAGPDGPARQPDQKSMGRVKKFSRQPETARPVKPDNPSGQPAGQNGPARGPYALIKKHVQRCVFNFGALLSLPDFPFPSIFLSLSRPYLSHFSSTQDAGQEHERRQCSPFITSRLSSTVTSTTLRLSSTVTSTTLLARNMKGVQQQENAVQGEHRATIELRFADDSDSHDHREDRFSRSSSLFFDL